MAKQAKAPGFSFKDMRGMMETISKKTAIVIEDKIKEKTWIDTDIYMLNALLSKSILNGGISKNRITIFVGEESVGKSYLCYNIARNSQKKENYNVIYIDTEFSVELGDLEQFGIDISPEKFMLIRSNKVEDIKFMLSQFLDGLKQQKMKGVEIDKTIIFLDSIGQLASNKEVEDAVEGKSKADMSRAKAIKSLFRIINSDLGYLDIPMVCTNHQYMSQDLFPKAIQSGGKGVDYSASTIVYLTKAKLKTGNEDENDLGASGIIVTALARKNRNAKPKKIKFEINHSTGTNKYTGLEMFCTVENFDKIGIAKVKPDVDKKTGEITYKASAGKWYVKHLDKTFYDKQLFTSKVFTMDILKIIDPIAIDYFSYASQEDIEKTAKEMDEMYEEFEEDSDFDIDSENDGQLFD